MGYVWRDYPGLFKGAAGEIQRLRLAPSRGDVLHRLVIKCLFSGVFEGEQNPPMERGRKGDESSRIPPPAEPAQERAGEP